MTARGLLGHLGNMSRNCLPRGEGKLCPVAPLPRSRMTPWRWLPGTPGLCECECSMGTPGVLSHILREAPGQEARDIQHGPKVRPWLPHLSQAGRSHREIGGSGGWSKRWGWGDSEMVPRGRPRQPPPGITHICCCLGCSLTCQSSLHAAGRQQAHSREASQWSRLPGW